MEIKKVRITRKSVVIDYHNEGEEHGITAHDAPLPSFVKAIENLAPVVLALLGLPSDYIHGLSPVGITLTEKLGSWQVSIHATKELSDTSDPFSLATPPRFLAVPTEEGSYSPPLSDAHVDLINEVINEAKAYVGGQRAQGQLPLTKDGEDGPTEPQGGDVLDFGSKPAPAGEAEEAKAKRSRKSN